MQYPRGRWRHELAGVAKLLAMPEAALERLIEHVWGTVSLPTAPIGERTLSFPTTIVPRSHDSHAGHVVCDTPAWRGPGANALDSLGLARFVSDGFPGLTIQFDSLGRVEGILPLDRTPLAFDIAAVAAANPSIGHADLDRWLTTIVRAIHAQPGGWHRDAAFELPIEAASLTGTWVVSCEEEMAALVRREIPGYAIARPRFSGGPAFAIEYGSAGPLRVYLDEDARLDTAPGGEAADQWWHRRAARRPVRVPPPDRVLALPHAARHT